MTNELPKFYEIFIPALDVLKEAELLRHAEIRTKVIARFYSKLPQELLNRKVPTGVNSLLHRIGWALSYLKMAGYVQQPKRGFYEITQKGLTALSKGSLSLNELKSQPEYIEHRRKVDAQKDKKADKSFEKTDVEDIPPIDLIDEGIRKIKATVKSQLLDKLKVINPYDFESLILQLLKAMGYGDTISTNKSNDGGIDGIINEDKLGLEKIYLQAKRYNDQKVREKEIRNFIGAMSGDTNKGVFVTTSEFDEKAKQKADSAAHKIILIEGSKLVELMHEYGVGVQVKSTLEIKELDNDFFEEE